MTILPKNDPRTKKPLISILILLPFIPSPVIKYYLHQKQNALQPQILKSISYPNTNIEISLPKYFGRDLLFVRVLESHPPGDMKY